MKPTTKLKLNAIRKDLKLHIQKNICMDGNIKSLANSDFGDVIDYDVFLPSKNKNLQRPFCWTLFQKQELILSLLKGTAIAPISIIVCRKAGDNSRKLTYKIIDGKQRLSTVISFYRNEFPIFHDDVKYYYKDLDTDAQFVVWNFYFDTNRAHEYSDDIISDDVKIAWFEIINFAGTLQDIEHLKYLKE